MTREELGVRRAAVLGSPIAHSLSPVLHRAAYGELGLDWSYQALECDEQHLPGLLDGLDDSWVGLSLTMPLKQAVLPLLDEISELASRVGGANTVVFASGRRWGDNTDVGGLRDVLTGRGVHRLSRPVVLGAGATACSVVAALHDLGCEDVAVVVRNPTRTAMIREVAERLGVRVAVHTFDDLRRLLPAPLLVSTLPASGTDRVAELFAEKGGEQSPGLVIDVCYEPWPTRLAAAADTAGHDVAGGFEVLLHQAARQVMLMTNRTDVPLGAMRAAGERALAERSP